GRTLGLLGFGSIGHEVAVRALAFGMPVVVWSRRFANGRERPQDTGLPIEVARTPQELAERVDVLSVHLALTPDTRGLVNDNVLARLQPGSYFINTARGEVVDQAALERAVRDRGIRAGLDVFTDEPSSAVGEFTATIAQLPLVYGTPHVGGSTD